MTLSVDYITKNFTWQEVTQSREATANGRRNALPRHLRSSALRMAKAAENVRSLLGGYAGYECPIFPTSWYRSAWLNMRVGGHPRSSHRLAAGMDLLSPAYGHPFDVATAISENLDYLGLGQVIYEGSWVHIQTLRPGRDINRIITVRWDRDGRRKTLVGIVE